MAYCHAHAGDETREEAAIRAQLHDADRRSSCYDITGKLLSTDSVVAS